MVDKKHDKAELQEDDLIPEAYTDSDESNLEDFEETLGDKIKKLQAKLKECEQEKSDHLEEVQRIRADFLNARKRIEQDRVNEKDRLINNFVVDLLPLFDSFRMAMQNQEAWNAVDKNWRMGIEGIYSQLNNLLQNYNVKVIEPVNEIFDPITQEAVNEILVNDEAQNDIVQQVIQSGFTRIQADTKEALLRPARVTVGKFKNNN